jgi:2-keto-3-deoxy-L-rhamnonate aldolase RhmA
MSVRLKEALLDRESLVGTWLTVGHPAVAELQAELGFDFAVVDAEHAPVSTETVAAMARAVDAADGPTEPLVRVADGDPTRIKRALDTGVSGVVVPMVETAAQARDAVAAARYPPEGSRGVAGTRASAYGLDLADHFERANDEVVVVVQIETAAGVENARAIAGVDGVDALFVGPADLSASLGAFGDADAIDTEISAVLDAGHDADTAVGTIAFGAEEAARWVDAGFDFQAVGTDADYLARGGRDALDAYADATGSADGADAGTDGGEGPR